MKTAPYATDHVRRPGRPAPARLDPALGQLARNALQRRHPALPNVLEDAGHVRRVLVGRPLLADHGRRVALAGPPQRLSAIGIAESRAALSRLRERRFRPLADALGFVLRDGRGVVTLGTICP